MFILIGTGVTTIIMSKSFLISDFDNNIMFFGVCIEIVIFVIILTINRRINHFINKL